MYYLSELGQNQLASNSRLLSLYERRLLRHVAQGQSVEEIRAYVGVGDVAETLYVLAKNGYLSKDRPAPEKPASATTSSLLRHGIAGVLKEVSTAIGKTAAEISTLPPIFSTPEKSPPAVASMHHAISTAPPTMAAKPALVLASNNEAPKTPAAVPATELHPELRQRLVAIVQESGARHLGLFSRDIIALCEHAKTLDAMQIGISRWHIALLESKTGKDHAFDYLQQINALLQSENKSQAVSA